MLGSLAGQTETHGKLCMVTTANVLCRNGIAGHVTSKVACLNLVGSANIPENVTERW